MQLPVTVSLQPSRRLAALLIVAHGLVAAALSPLSLPVWLMFALLAAILASAWRSRRQFASPRRIHRLTLRTDGRLEFSRVDGSGGEAVVQPQTTVTSFLCVLVLRTQGSTEALVLLPDALPAADFRRLRLWLRWCARRSETKMSA